MIIEFDDKYAKIFQLLVYDENISKFIRENKNAFEDLIYKYLANSSTLTSVIHLEYDSRDAIKERLRR